MHVNAACGCVGQLAGENVQRCVDVKQSEAHKPSSMLKNNQQVVRFPLKDTVYKLHVFNCYKKNLPLQCWIKAVFFVCECEPGPRMCVSFVSSTCATVRYSNANAEFPFLTGLACTSVYLARLLPVQGMVVLFAHARTHTHTCTQKHLCRITPSSACAHMKNGISRIEARTHTHWESLWSSLVGVCLCPQAGWQGIFMEFLPSEVQTWEETICWSVEYWRTLCLSVCVSLSLSLSRSLSLWLLWMIFCRPRAGVWSDLKQDELLI